MQNMGECIKIKVVKIRIIIILFILISCETTDRSLQIVNNSNKPIWVTEKILYNKKDSIKIDEIYKGIKRSLENEPRRIFEGGIILPWDTSFLLTHYSWKSQLSDTSNSEVVILIVDPVRLENYIYNDDTVKINPEIVRVNLNDIERMNWVIPLFNEK